MDSGRRRTAGTVARALFDIARPLNCIVVAAAVAVGFVFARGCTWSQPALIWAALSGFLVTAFGNTLNDLCDAELDGTAHPARPLPSGRLSRQQANLFAGWALAVGILAAFAAAGAWTAGFAAVNVGLLVLYELRLKAHGFAGNVVVAALSASAFIFGAVAAGVGFMEVQGPTGIIDLVAGPVGVLAGMAGFASLAREMLKDLQDAAADRASRRTMATRWGRNVVVGSAALCIALAIAVQWFPIGWPDIGLLHGWLLPADLLLVAGVVAAWKRPQLGQTFAKLGMIAAMVPFGVLAWATGGICYNL